MIEDYEHPGQYKGLIQALRKHNVEVRLMASDRLFGSLVELQQYDSIILADVPREHFTDAQILMLARNTQQMGAGLVMLAGRTASAPAAGPTPTWNRPCRSISTTRPRKWSPAARWQ